MMTQIKITILGLALCLPVSGYSQKIWTLEECIDYAIENNLEVKKKEVTIQQQELELNTAQFSRLPSLSGSSSQSFNFGRGLNETNAYVNRNTQNTSFELSTDIPLFTGLQIPNNIALQKLNLKATIEDLNQVKENIEIEVTAAFLQVLFNEEIYKVSLEQVELSKSQYERMTQLYELGKTSIADVYEVKARVDQDQLSAIESENSWKISLLNLSQLLELPSPEGFYISVNEANPTLSELTNPEDIFNQALLIRPGIIAAQYRLQGMEKNIAIAQSSYYPKLTFGASLGSSYYHVSGSDRPSFGKQLDNNFSKYLGFRLSVPIFNRFQTRNRVKYARLQQTDQSISLEDHKKTLYKEIQQAYYNAVAARSKFLASTSAVDSYEAAFRLMSEKYENGKANFIEYNETKMYLMKAISDHLQAKYEYIFRTKILDFYQGEPLRF